MARNDSPGKPKREPFFKQLRTVYSQVRQIDPRITLWMILAFVVTLAVVVGIGFLAGYWIYALIMGLPLALIAALLVMNRRATKAAYRQLEGRPGAGGAALSSLRRGWYYDQQPVAVDTNRATKMTEMTDAAMVYRALGRPGIVLLAEGPRGRAHKLLKAEEKKVARVAPGVPVHAFVIGDGEGELPISKVSGKLSRLRPVLTKQETSVVNKRLKSLGGLRPAVPKGMDPSKVRVDRKAMRGR